MDKEKLNEILKRHEDWLDKKENGKRADLSRADLSGADLSSAALRGADLSYANLRGVDLRGADLDYSCLPLWCGSLDAHMDDRQIIQLLYHTVRNALFSKNTSDEVKVALVIMLITILAEYIVDVIVSAFCKIKALKKQTAEAKRVAAFAADTLNEYTRLYKKCESLINAYKARSDLKYELESLEKELDEHFPCPF